MADQVDNGILILGSPRSGTTLLRRVLGAHSNIACPAETGLLRASAKFLESEISGVGVEMGVLSGLSHAGFEKEEVIRRLREFTFSFFNEYANKAGKVRWLEKDGFTGLYVDGIEALCKDHVKYVVMVRHGLDVAPSIRDLCDKSESMILDTHKYLAREKQPLVAFTQLWADINRSLYGLCERRKDQVILVKYEELVANPEAEIKRILAFLGEDYSSDLLDSLSRPATALGLGDWKTYSKPSIDSGSVNRWHSLHPYLLSQMAEIANPVLTLFGYQNVSATWDDDPELARRRYEIALRLNSIKSG